MAFFSSMPVSAQRTVAADDSYTGGVFAQGRRVTPEQIALSAEPATPVRAAAFFKEPQVDERGAVSQIVLQIETTPGLGETVSQLSAASGCSSAVDCANALLDSINNRRDTALLAGFGQPLGARFLIEDYRMTDKERISAAKSDPALELQRYIVLRYASLAAARTALQSLTKRSDVARAALDQTMSYSATWTWTGANDPYLNWQSSPASYQWGMSRMNFPAAWNLTPGSAYIGTADGGVPLVSEQPSYFGNCWNGNYYVYSFHCDLADNFRPQLSLAPGARDDLRAIHGIHVTGIIAARGGNGQGVSGGCPWCSVAMGRANGSPGPLATNAAAAVSGLVDRGIQVINISANAWSPNAFVVAGWMDSIRCSDSAASSFGSLCSAISYAAFRDVNIVAAASNYVQTHRPDNIYVKVPTLPATETTVLAVGGIQPDDALWNQWAENGSPFYEQSSSAFSGSSGVVAPAKNIISTMAVESAAYSAYSYAQCGDTSTTDASGIYGDKYGTCTGTSMAAPHVTALVGLVRSANPLLDYAQVNNIVRNSGDLAPYWMTSERGSGVPNAYNAVAAAINTNSSRLTPLFSFYSSARNDYFYTVVPQMGGAALRGTLRPANESYVGGSSAYAVVGTSVPGISNFPGMYYWQGVPAAQAWVFSTPTNPLNASLPLAPLFRLSWKCGDGGVWVSTCSSYPAHVDTAYTADPAGISAFMSVGYNLDGGEGFIYPKTMAQPYGTVRLLRKYNPTRDDHAIFPEVTSIVNDMWNQGYTENSGSDWLGWVYPNDGYQPTVQ